METKAVEKLMMDMRATEEFMPAKEYVIPDADIMKRIDLVDNVNVADRSGMTLLMHAIVGRRVAVVKYLIDRGADVNISDRNNYTPLHFAAQEGVLEIVEKVLKAGGRVNTRDSFGNNPIMRCKTTADIRIFELLLKYGENPHQKNDYGVSAADCFVAYPEISEILSQVQ